MLHHSCPLGPLRCDARTWINRLANAIVWSLIHQEAAMKKSLVVTAAVTVLLCLASFPSQAQIGRRNRSGSFHHLRRAEPPTLLAGSSPSS